MPTGYGVQHLIHFIEVGFIRRTVLKLLGTGESPLALLRILYNPYNTMLGPDWVNNRLGSTLKITADGRGVEPINGYTYDMAALDGFNLREYRFPISLNYKQMNFAREAGVL